MPSKRKSSAEIRCSDRKPRRDLRKTPQKKKVSLRAKNRQTTPPDKMLLGRPGATDKQLYAVLRSAKLPQTEAAVTQLLELVTHIPDFTPGNDWPMFARRCEEEIAMPIDRKIFERLRWLFSHQDLAQEVGFYWKVGWKQPALNGIEDLPEPTESGRMSHRATVLEKTRGQSRDLLHKLRQRAIDLVTLVWSRLLRRLL